ncbi:TonB-dependent siderophore receptor [Metapseudomonas otitidis]|uniref:TonB-dependent siderophore receptor n=1 Tax=Metapseudomonas otitidis TaxID=319939 RepID=UPI0040558E06
MQPATLFSLHPLAQRVRCLALVLAASTAAVALPLNAADGARHFAVPAGSLGTALVEFAVQAGITLPIDPALVQGRSSPGLNGDIGIEAGLEALLHGSGLRAVREGEGLYGLQPVGDEAGLQLAPTTVASTASESAYGPVVGYIATRSATGTKTDASLLEVPQSINVVTADQMQAQGAQDLTQALRYTPGIGVNGFTDRNVIADEITSRGFAPAALYLDGAYLPYAGSLGGAPQIDPYTLERAEVLKGPASVLYGQNQPGGLVNLVSKRPTGETRNQVKFGLGDDHRVNGALDTQGVLDTEQDLAYRLVALARKGNGQVDHTRNGRLLLAPSFSWAVSDDTDLTLLAQVQRDDGKADYQALPRIGSLVRGPNGQRIDRDFFSGDSNYNDYQRDQYVFGYDFEHRFDDDLKFRSTARYIDVRDRYKGFYLRGFVVDGLGQTDYTRVNRVKLDWRQHNTTYTLDNNLTYSFDTGPVQHTTLVGVDYRDFNRKYQGYNAYSVLPIDLYGRNNYDTSSVTPQLDTRWDNTVRQTGLYLQDQLRLGNWLLTLGGRQDWAEVENKDLLARTETTQRDNRFTARAGLTYLTAFGLAPYISYSESFMPTVGTGAPERGGKAFEPIEGVQYEAGVKYQPHEELLLTASVFEITQKNVRTGDVDYPQYEIQSGQMRTRGAELEAKARLGRFDVLLSGSYLDAFYTRDTYGNEGSRSEAQAPVSAAAWVDYHLVGLPGVTWGAGARYTGRKPGDAANSFSTPAYVVYDTTLRYQLGELSADLKGLQASLNVQNLFDRDYVSDCNYAFGCYYGQERTASLEVTYDW